MNKKKYLLNFILFIAISITLYFSIQWYRVDDSGEAVFAIITTLLIPLILYIKREKPKDYNIEIVKKNIKINDIIDVEFPEIIYKNNSIVESNINRTIRVCYLSYSLDIKSSTFDEDLEYLEGSFEHVYTLNNICGVVIGLNRYFKGAAHPNHE